MPKFILDFMFSPYRRKMLAVLLLHPDERFHIRKLERLTGISAGSLHRELKAMAESGLLIRQQQGNQVLYQADKTCVVYEELASIFRKTEGLAIQLKDALQPIMNRVEFAFIFGSMATGNQHKDSDIDVCVLGTVEYVEVVKAFSDAQEILRRDINPVVMTTNNFREKFAGRDRFAERVVEEPKIFLIGDQDEFEQLMEDRTAGAA